MWSSSKEENYVDKRGDKAFCLLCCVQFDHDNCDDHIDTEIHQKLMQGTEKRDEKKSSTKNDQCDSDISNKVLNENHSNLKDKQSHGNVSSNQKSKNILHKPDISNEALEEINSTTVPVKPSVKPGKENADYNYVEFNYIQYNKVNQQALCELCNIFITANIHDISEHVNASTHKIIKDEKGIQLQNHAVDESILYKATTWDNFVQSIDILYEQRRQIPLQVSPILGLFVNRTFYIERDSFILLKKKNHQAKEYKCKVCDRTIPEYNVPTHILSQPHVEYCKQSVLVDMEKEFIREIKPGTLFHCGFCNKYCYHWSHMQRHLETKQHNFACYCAMTRNNDTPSNYNGGTNITELLKTIQVNIQYVRSPPYQIPKSS